jgi:replicative DNA helicase
MNREADKVQVPRLSNLADSSAVEQDSDIVIFLHRQGPTSVETDFIIGKHRHGMQSTEKVELNTVTMMFEQANEWSA